MADDTPTIPNALTASEWAARHFHRETYGTDVRIKQAEWVGEAEALVVGNGCYDYSGHSGAGRHALAALALHGQPFGFDGEELNQPAASIVEALRDTADTIDAALGTKMPGAVTVTGPAGAFSLPSWYPEIFRACATRIAALLPPPEETP